MELKDCVKTHAHMGLPDLSKVTIEMHVPVFV